MSDDGVWVYAVAQAGSLREGDAGIGASTADPLPGVAGGPVRLVSVSDLTAVVSPVDLAEFGEEPLRRNLERLPWLEAVARSHHGIVAAVAKTTAVMPMRLATVYRSEQGLAAMLGERHGDFIAALGRIAGRSEWGVKAYVARAAQSSEPRRDRRPGTPSRPGSGADYLKKRRAALSATEQARQNTVATAERVHSQLAGRAVAAALHRPQDPQLSGTDDRMVINASYLVDDERQTEFTATVEQAATTSPELRLELTGPWPPYSFAAADPGGPAPGARAPR